MFLQNYGVKLYENILLIMKRFSRQRKDKWNVIENIYL